MSVATGRPERPHRIRVACALLEREGRVLAAQRSASMSLPLMWEFPGGKIEEGEAAEDCLRRELREELGVEVTVLEALPTADHRYPTFAITLHPFRCVIASGTIMLHEHAAVAWLEPRDLASLDWAPADLPVIAAYVAGRTRVPRRNQ